MTEVGRGDAIRVLRAMALPGGADPIRWLLSPLVDARRILELPCGRGGLGTELGSRWVGVDPCARRTPTVRGLPTAVPVRENGVDAVLTVLALPRLPALDEVFAEVRRVLEPGGSFVALVPSASVRSLAELRYAAALRPVRRGRWRNRSALDSLGWLLHAADFAVPADDRVVLSLPLDDAAEALRLVDDLPAAGIWPDLTESDRRSVVSGLVRLAGPQARLPIPVRRVVGRR